MSKSANVRHHDNMPLQLTSIIDLVETRELHRLSQGVMVQVRSSLGHTSVHGNSSLD